MKDYYSALGVSKDADEVVIRAAYKALAQKYHPDKVTPELRSSYTGRMAEINEAYEFLAEGIKRKSYGNQSYESQDVNQTSSKENPQKVSKKAQNKFGSLEGIFFMGFLILGLWALLSIVFLF